MNKVTAYLDRIPLGLLAAVIFLCIIIYTLLPLRSRLPIMLAATCLWFTISICPALGVIKDLFKILLPALLTLLLITAYKDPAPRKALPGICKIYIAMAAAQFLYILNTTNRIDAMVYCIQWLLMVLAINRITESITSWKRLTLIITSLGIGATLASLFALTSFHNREFSLAAGRYFPYGAHPNHIAITFILSATLCFLYSQQPMRTRTKTTMMILGGIGLVQLLMTVSRTSIVAATLPIGLLFFHYLKKPGQAILALFILSTVLLYGLDKTAKFNYKRLKSLNTPRTQIYEDYFAEIEARPFTGLMFSQNKNMFQAGEDTLHAHSSYLYILYIGGLSYALPLLLLAATSLFSSLHIWMQQAHMNHRLFPALAFLMVACYIIALSVAELYKPVSLLSFIHLLLSMILISIAMDKERMIMLRHPN